MDLKEKFEIEFSEAAKRNTPFILYLNFAQAWALLCALQFAIQTPKLNSLPQSRRHAEIIGRSLGRIVCYTPAMREVEQMAWADAQLPESLHLEKNLN